MNLYSKVDLIIVDNHGCRLNGGVNGSRIGRFRTDIPEYRYVVESAAEAVVRELKTANPNSSYSIVDRNPKS